MILGQELLVWLNSKAAIERIGDFADLVAEGHLRITSDADSIIAVAATASTPFIPKLPSTAA